VKAVIVVELEFPDNVEGEPLLNAARAVVDAAVPYAEVLHLAIREDAARVLEVFSG